MGGSCGSCGTLDCNGNCNDPCANQGGSGCSDFCSSCAYECLDFFGLCECQNYGDPILLDLSGTGFWMTDAKAGVNFDFFGTGKPIRISWTKAGVQNGWLALDRNHDGQIRSGQELFGNASPQPGAAVQRLGFKALAVYDTRPYGGNGDGVIDARDSIYSKLLIWVDKNHNGVADPGEVMPLAKAGITSISVDYHDANYVDAFGNQFRYRARVEWANHKLDGKDHWAYDVILVSPDLPVAKSKGGK
jgi:hypothetical protein